MTNLIITYKTLVTEFQYDEVAHAWVKENKRYYAYPKEDNQDMIILVEAHAA